MGRKATRAEVAAITKEQAKEFYRKEYIQNSPFRDVSYEPLRAQLIDTAVLSGPARTIRWLQRVLDIPVTGLMDERTKTALARDKGMLVNNAYVAARIKMFHNIVAADASQVRFIRGWVKRAIGFAEFKS